MGEKEVINGYGHQRILATHRTTMEITKSSHLTEKGDCIIAVSADKALADLQKPFKRLLCSDGAKLTILVEAGTMQEIIEASGSSRLILKDPVDMVIRRSDHICGRTLAIKADKAANDLSGKMLEKLRLPGQQVKITLAVET